MPEVNLLGMTQRAVLPGMLPAPSWLEMEVLRHTGHLGSGDHSGFAVACHRQRRAGVANQRETVHHVLRELGMTGAQLRSRVVEVWNKADVLEKSSAPRLAASLLSEAPTDQTATPSGGESGDSGADWEPSLEAEVQSYAAMPSAEGQSCADGAIGKQPLRTQKTCSLSRMLQQTHRQMRVVCQLLCVVQISTARVLTAPEQARTPRMRCARQRCPRPRSAARGWTSCSTCCTASSPSSWERRS